jgi:Na+/H+ antiporter NhaD/arsenite permease-like protein
MTVAWFSLVPAAMPEWRCVAAYAVFLVSYFVFAAGKLPGMKIDRPGMAIIGAVGMVLLRVIRPQDALRYIDFSTIVLLFSMMLLIGFLHLSGFFDWVAESVITRLSPDHLLPAVIFTSGILSAFFVNDVICLVMAPVVLLTTQRMRLKPLPYLLALATGSNIGSVATITGNPQNMLIGSVSHISYRGFLAHLGPIALMGLLLDWLVLWLMFHRMVSGGATPPAVSPASVNPGAGRHLPAVVDRRRLRKPVTVMAVVVLGFLGGAPPAVVTALAAAIMLITRRHDPQKAYAEVNWDLLVFFVGLFLIVGGAEASGLTSALLAFAERWNLHRGIAFTAVTAGLSNLVSNVPAVMLIKNLVPSLPNPRTEWLLLAMASTLAGNLTITGSVANLIVVERVKAEVHIGFWDYVRVGLPVTLLTLAMGWAWLTWVAR